MFQVYEARRLNNVQSSDHPPLGAFLSSYVGFLAARALMGLGIGVISYSAIAIALELLYAQAQGYYGNIPAFGQGLGIIMGAITFRMTFVLLPKLE